WTRSNRNSMLMKHDYQGVEYFLTISIKIKDIAHYSTQRSPRAPKKSLPKNGKPGLFANTIILKSGCMGMLFALRALPLIRGTIRLPSDRIISSDSTRV
ncbi:hypothetical protein ALC56_13732, partial [Trachymyrmex septentrionalis]